MSDKTDQASSAAESPICSAAATVRDTTFLLLTFAVAMGFTHRFGYMQRLGSQMELGDQQIPQLAVDALETISQQWLLYSCAMVLGFVMIVLGRIALRRGVLPLHANELTAAVVITFTLVLSGIEFKDGAAEADHFYQASFAGLDRHAHQIFVPSRATSTEECYAHDLAASTPPPRELPKTIVYWYLTAESSNRYHVIRQTIERDGSRPPKVEPIVIEAGMLNCFQQVDPIPPGALIVAKNPTKTTGREVAHAP